MKRPPLGLSVEIETAGGRTYRWDGDSRKVEDRPRGITFRTQRGDGFADASVTLRRRIDRDYSDLGLLDTIRFIADDGAIRYEGRIAGAPRSLEDGHSIQVEAVGWMTHAKDRPFREIYVDRDLSSWTGASRTRKISLYGSGIVPIDAVVDQDTSSGMPALSIRWEDQPAVRWIGEGLYDAGPGLEIASVYYDIQRDNTTEIYFIGGATDDSYSPTSPNLTAGGAGTYTLSPAKRFIHFLAERGNTAANHMFAICRRLALFGNHTLTKRGSAPDQGYYVSDMLRDSCKRFAPKLDPSGVNDTSYVVQQAAYRSGRDRPHDVWLAWNGFHDWELAVWEKRVLHYHAPTQLDDYDWEVRLDDPGTRVQLSGDSTERLANGVVVTYTDLVTGEAKTLYPDQYAELRDDSEENPANKHGIDKWEPIEIPFATVEADALQYGRMALAEFNTPSAPGRIVVAGHIRDRQGNWHAASEVRAGERVVISNHPNDRPRRITSTNWNQDTKRQEMAVEQDARRVEVLFARIQSGRQAVGS